MHRADGWVSDVKLATSAVDSPTGATTRIGVADGDDLSDLTAGYGRVLADDGRDNPAATARALVPPDMRAFLANGDEAMAAAREVAADGFDADARGPTGARIRYALDRDEVALQAPLPTPTSVRDCIAFEEHLRNTIRL